MQDRYWNLMLDKKFYLFYLSKHFEQTVKTNRVIKIIGAIASCSSIAAWTIWNEYAFIWGAIIAVSQVISAINEFLPYQKRIEDISDLKSELDKVYLKYEENWFDVSEGHLSNKEINTLLYKLENEWNDVTDKYFLDDTLPTNKSCIKYANNQLSKYLNNFGSKPQ